MPRVFGGEDARKAFKKGRPDLAKENTVCHIQILGLGTDCDDASPSVLLFFDRQRYLFNAGEGFQRFCVEHKVKMNRVSSCLLTRLDGQASGGLAGMCLTMADAGEGGPSQRPQLDLIGPEGLNYLTTSIRSLISTNAVGINSLEFGDDRAGIQMQDGGKRTAEGVLSPVIVNDLLNITPVLLRSCRNRNADIPMKDVNPSGGTIHQETSEGNDGGASLEPAAKKAKIAEKAAKKLGPQLFPPSPLMGFTINGPVKDEYEDDLCAACYICELTRVRGKFLPNIAKELGVPPGQAFSTLKNGQPYTLEDGTVIQPEQVNEPFHPGPIAIIADCPAESYLNSLASDPTWKPFYADTEKQPDDPKQVDVIVHLARAEVVALTGYKSWLEKFGPTTKHIFVNSQATQARTIMQSSAAIQAQLNCLHPEIFPLHCVPEMQSTHSGEAVMEVTGNGPQNGQTKSQETAGVSGVEGADKPINTKNGSIENGSPSGDKAGDASAKIEAATAVESSQSVDLALPNAPETHFAGMNLLKLHLRPPSRKGQIDASEVTQPLDLEAIQAKVRGNEDLMAALAEAKEQGLAVDTGRGQSGNNALECDEPPGGQAVPPGSSQAASLAPSPQKTMRQKLLDRLLSSRNDDGSTDESLDSSHHTGLIKSLGSECLEITFLGTGAAVPSKYRNVTGIYLNMFDKGGMLVDCGEGSLGQLKRRFGPKLGEVVCGLKCIWISHIHTDHHAGLTRILALRRELLGNECQPVTVFGPKSLHRTLVAWAQLQPICCHYIDNGATVLGHPGPREEYNKQAVNRALDGLGISHLQSFTVDHCAHAFGLSLTGASGWSLVFSGDTRPCRNVVQAAKNALVLIHEATFEDALEEEAVAKRHSTTFEAVEVGHRARAYRTVLTHFSQRYPKIPVVESSFKTTTCIAFDLMTFNLTDLAMLPWLVQPISQMFQPDYSQLPEEAPNMAPEASTLGAAAKDTEAGKEGKLLVSDGAGNVSALADNSGLQPLKP